MNEWIDVSYVHFEIIKDYWTKFSEAQGLFLPILFKQIDNSEYRQH